MNDHQLDEYLLLTHQEGVYAAARNDGTGPDGDVEVRIGETSYMLTHEEALELHRQLHRELHATWVQDAQTVVG